MLSVTKQDILPKMNRIKDTLNKNLLEGTIDPIRSKSIILRALDSLTCLQSKYVDSEYSLVYKKVSIVINWLFSALLNDQNYETICGTINDIVYQIESEMKDAQETIDGFIGEMSWRLIGYNSENKKKIVPFAKNDSLELS